MNAFNDLNGIPATGHKVLQRDLLKRQWNWNGFVVSDWGSIGEMKTHGFAVDTQHAAELAITAGSDMDMQSFSYDTSLKTLVEKDKISIVLVDDAVRRVLRIKFQLGLFDDPYKYCDEDLEAKELYTEANLAIARDVAKKSIVLLKNDNALLPLSKELKSIAVIGSLADDKNSPLGNWRGKGAYNSAVSLLEGVSAALGENTKIYFEKGVELTIPTVAPGQNQFSHALKFNTTNRSGIPKAVEAAKKSRGSFIGYW